MKKIKINFQNCYGIKDLKYEFNFQDNCKTICIYSPNGTMKTSFLKTFKNYNSDKIDETPCDQIDKNLKSIFEIKDESDYDFDKNKIFAIESLPDTYKISDQVNVLLLNLDLKAKYENIKKAIDEAKDDLIHGLLNSSKLKDKNEFEKEFTQSFATENTMQGFIRLINEIKEEEFDEYGTIEYNNIFDDKVMALLNDIKFIDALSKYVDEYNLIISNSTFFKKGFNHYQADEISKKLKENGFFKAEHYLTLSNGQEIKNDIELEKLIKDEKSRILSDIDSKKFFENIDKKIQKNKETRNFLTYITTNPNIAKLILEHKNNLNLLKQKIFKGYIQQEENIEKYNNLIEINKNSQALIDNIKNNIKANNTKWYDVVNIFNERFNVPFKVVIENVVDAILGDNPKISFKFNGISVKEDTLKKNILSNGEKRALYLLNIIFEIEIRKLKKQETFFIIDDIADSFDYKNKYAIMEYLNDISKEENFYQIILTHNYDFYRAISLRLGKRGNNLFAMKNKNNGITIEDAFYQSKNPLITIKENLHNVGLQNNIGLMPICAIPFARNIIEYTKSTTDNNYLKLTSLLHIKEDTCNIKLSDLKDILHETISSSEKWSGYELEKSVITYIYEKADFIINNELDNSYLVRLEPKIVLSIASRLKTEEFLIMEFEKSKIDYKKSIEKTNNQTRILIELYKKNFLDGYKKMQDIFERVLLITSENIHLNSFMYEPLLDTSNYELIELYKDIIKKFI